MFSGYAGVANFEEGITGMEEGIADAVGIGGEWCHGHESTESEAHHGVDCFCEVWYGGEVAAELVGFSCGIDLNEQADGSIEFECGFLNFLCESECVYGMDEVDESCDFFGFVSLEVADHVPAYLIGNGDGP